MFSLLIFISFFLKKKFLLLYHCDPLMCAVCFIDHLSKKSCKKIQQPHMLCYLNVCCLNKVMLFPWVATRGQCTQSPGNSNNTELCGHFLNRLLVEMECKCFLYMYTHLPTLDVAVFLGIAFLCPVS